MDVNMDMYFQQIGFAIEKTKDDSPTLRLIDGSERGGESMHHTGGAFSETCLIYGQALEYGFSKNSNPRIVSLGLGLGYVEILSVVFSLLHKSSTPLIFSYEKVPGLKKQFKDFFTEGKISETYQWILNQMSKTYQLDVNSVFKAVKNALEDNRLQLKGDFVNEALELKTFDIFCYDAFSKKTSPELWDENFMTPIFAKGSEVACVSSYASNRELKTSLANAGFKVEVLEGFQGKRNRTWAYRP